MSLETNSQCFEKMQSALSNSGFINVVKITDTLQGIIFKAVEKSSNEPIVIKMTNKYLHQNAMAYINDKVYRNLKEDIIQEASILKHLTQQRNTHESIIKYCNFLECANNYYLVMTDGGNGLFDFVKEAHILISSMHIPMDEWYKVVKVIFKQMIGCLEYIHSKNVCHFDISLENFLINDVQVCCRQQGDIHSSQITFDLNDIRIRLIDFGLATFFEDSDFRSKKFCGKKCYKSPEVVAKQPFNAMKNDIWCLGICLFMMVFGRQPWPQAIETDMLFKLMTDGYLVDVLESWGVCDIDHDLIDLFESFYRYEDDRISLEEIKRHPWIKY